MTLSSPAFVHGGAIPPLYTCNGSDISPPLRFHDVPPEAKSLALIMDDPDVPRSIKADGVWDHWIIWNMPSDTGDIGEDAVPPGVVGTNSSGKTEYQGPCPPDKEHRYIFRLYALDALLDSVQTMTKAEVLAAMNNHVVATAELIGTYRQP